MLSLAVIKASPAVAARYYTEGDYYTKDGDEPSEWSGSGAAQLGLDGTVDTAAFKDLLGGMLPEGHVAGWEGSGKDHRPGWDLTFSAPKGLSVMAIVAGDTRLIDAHNKAVAEALAFAETYAHVRERTDDKSYRIKPTASTVVAQFTEFFSRALDPHLHTHCVFANATYDKDRDAWYALHSDALYAMKMAIGQVYRNALALEVRPVGYSPAVERDTGLFDLKGVPCDLLGIYSQRRSAILDYAEKHDWASAAKLARATLLTRPNKAKTEHDRVLSDLRERAGEHLEHIEDLKQTSMSKEHTSKDHRPSAETSKQAAEHAVQHLAAREAVFEQGNLVKEALKVSIGDTRLGDVERALKKLEGRNQIQKTSFQTGGKYIFHGRTINQSIAWEAKVAEAIMQTRDQVWPLGSEARVNSLLQASKLTPEQAEAARFTLRSRDRALAIIGVAGAGKSHLIRSLKKATPSRTYLALAPTSTAAIDLGKSAGIAGQTLSRFLETGGRDIGRNSVLIVDEASMASTRQALRLLSIASVRKARVIFVGDTKQLDAVDQGNPLALLVDQGLRGPFIGRSFRQKNAAMRALVKDAREGNINKVLYQLGSRVKQYDPDKIASEIADAWWKHKNRSSIQIAALENASRIAINRELRSRLQTEGKIDERDHKFTILSSKALTHAQMRIADYYKMGDVLVFHMGQKSLGIERDQRFNVVGTVEKNILLADDKTGEKLSFDPAKTGLRGATLYESQKRHLAVGDQIQWRKNLRDDRSVQNGHTGVIKDIRGPVAKIAFDHGVNRELNLRDNPYWDHGYALTVYKQQGKTTPINWVVADTSRAGEINQKSLYVSLTRAEYSVALFTDDKGRFERAIRNNPGGKTSSLEGRGALADLKADITQNRQTLAEKLIDKLPDHLRTLGSNIVDIARERRGQQPKTTQHPELARLSALREQAEHKPDKILEQAVSRDR